MDDQRIYSDEEFGLILRKATALANRAELQAPSSTGFTLTEMKAAATQVGFDPALVERAARMLVATATASPLERLIGGPLRHEHVARFPLMLDENGAAQLLSAVRISAGPSGSGNAGHSGSTGMTWHDGDQMQPLGVTAQPDEESTVVSVVVDRRGTLSVVAMFSGMTMLLAVLFAVFALYPEAPMLGYGGLAAAIGGPLAIARSYWASSTRTTRERISALMDAVGRSISPTPPAPDRALPTDEEVRLERRVNS